jgi:hypothetical protein
MGADVVSAMDMINGLELMPYLSRFSEGESRCGQKVFDYSVFVCLIGEVHSVTQRHFVKVLEHDDH